MKEVSQATINSWKERYGSVYSMSAPVAEFIFRPVTVGEYEKIKQSPWMSSADAEEEFVRIAVLSPEQIPPNTPAGVVTALAEEIVEVSGFGSPKRAIEVLTEKRSISGDVQVLMKAFVLAMMPGYSEEDLNELTFQQLASKVALAEQIIQVHQAVMGVENEVRLHIIDPEEEAARAAAEAAAKAKREKEAWDRLKEKGHIAPDAAPPIAPKIDANDPIARKLRSALG